MARNLVLPEALIPSTNQSADLAGVNPPPVRNPPADAYAWRSPRSPYV